MSTIHLLWVEPPRVLRGVTAEADERVIRPGVIEPSEEAGFPGPVGSYRLLHEELWRTIDPDHPAPIFLHESHEALLERWTNFLPDAAAEVAIVARVRDAVSRLVETRLTADPHAVSVSPVVTTTEPTSQGMAVVGRCVLLRPARRLHPCPPPPESPRTPTDP